MASLNFLSRASTLITCARLSFSNRLTSFQPQVQAALFSASSRGSDEKGKVKVPQKPKRPISPFLRYVSEQRPSLMGSNPDLKTTDVVKKCASEWKLVDLSVKEKYQEDYKKEMEKFSKQYLEYASKLTPEQKEAMKEASAKRQKSRGKRLLKKKINETNKPKRPLQPYMLFLKHQTEIRNLKWPEAMKTLALEWKQLSEQEKAKYNDWFKKDSAKFEVELTHWETKMLREGNLELVRKSTIDKLDAPQRKMIYEKLGRKLGQSSPKRKSKVVAAKEEKGRKETSKPKTTGVVKKSKGE